LGTGLGQLVDLRTRVAINYTDIPNFPVSTVGISTQVNCWNFRGKKTIIMQGRFIYVSYTLQEITFPVRVLKALGITSLLVSNRLCQLIL
jgi:purine-nucleoside phosphorylase